MLTKIYSLVTVRFILTDFLFAHYIVYIEKVNIIQENANN